jgi:nitrite reductase (NO-forming)
MFEKVYPGADATQAIDGVSAYSVGPGQGAIFDLVIPKPGKYPFVDHDFGNLMLGAKGTFLVHAPGASLPAASSSAAFASQPGGAASAVAAPAAAPAGSAPPAVSTASAGSIATAAQPSAAPPAPAGPYAFDAARGAQLYGTNCAACHQPTGAGLPGAFPPLAGNEAVLDPNPSKQIDVILNGLHGEEVGGVTYQTAMPPFGASLNDVDIADIINHERSSWGNKGKPVTAKQVHAARGTGGE